MNLSAFNHSARQKGKGGIRSTSIKNELFDFLAFSHQNGTILLPLLNLASHVCIKPELAVTGAACHNLSTCYKMVYHFQQNFLGFCFLLKLNLLRYATGS